MLGKKWLKLIKSLHQKKYRNHHGLFFVEGKKSVEELIKADFKLVKLITVANYDHFIKDVEIEVVSELELKAISALKNPSGILAVFEMPEQGQFSFEDWVVVLDTVRDPGNLGTIIRLCDWYNVKTLVCSQSTVDLYNPKVLQATMGSIARVNVLYTDLTTFLSGVDLPIYGAYMKGENCHQHVFPNGGILVMGNEANGISDEVGEIIDRRIAIPQFGHATAESLNVAMATGILMNEIRRA